PLHADARFPHHHPPSDTFRQGQSRGARHAIMGSAWGHGTRCGARSHAVSTISPFFLPLLFPIFFSPPFPIHFPYPVSFVSPAALHPFFSVPSLTRRGGVTVTGVST